MNDRVKPSENDCAPHDVQQLDEKDRYGRDEVTGLEYVKRRPGERLVTSEEIRKELEDFP
jgi:hypothetical protein